jgi:two-component system sensor histidine kinase KdpD
MTRFNSLVISFTKYILSILITLSTTAVLVLTRNQQSDNTTIIALIYLLPVLFNTTIWGLGPGIITGLIALLAYDYFFLSPITTFAVHKIQDIVALLIFLILAILVSQLVGRAKAGLAAATEREHEMIRLYEYSTALSGLNNPKEIARIIAHKTLDNFQADFVELYVEGKQGFDSLIVQATQDTSKPANLPTSIVPLETARGLLGEIHLWRDLSLKGAEERMLQTIATQGTLALERAYLAQAETRAKVLEESDQMKSALLSSVSHDLRTPLSTIKAAVTSLLSDQIDWDTQSQKDLLNEVEEATDVLNHLVGNLLDMSRIEAGALKPNRQWNMLSEIVHDTLSEMHRITKSHRLEVNVSDDLPLIPVDYVQIEQVFTNLIGNSVKYTPTDTTIQISAQVSNESQAIMVQVKNEGPPVDEEHLERIFDKFYRVTNAESITGTGLGLSICKGIIQAHGGRIWAGNLPDGFVFNFTLPLYKDGKPPPVVESDNV